MATNEALKEELEPGTEVTVESARGRVRLVVVQDLGTTVAMTSRETFRAGATLRDAVGFKRSDIVEVHEDER